MTALKNKKCWSDPDPYNLNSPKVCASIAHAWSDTYLILNELIYKKKTPAKEHYK